MAQNDTAWTTYTGANLTSLYSGVIKIGAPVGTITSFKVYLGANVAADVEFTIKRNGSNLTTVDITTGNSSGISATISQACTEDDELQLDITDYTSGTVTAPISLYIYYTKDTTASTTQVLTGTDTDKNVTSDALAALWEKGSDIASAGTIAIGEGGFFHVTGTTTITDIDPATDKAGREFCLVFDGILTLTHHATTLILPTGANIVTAAGDTAYFRSEGSDAVRCVVYQRKDGTPLVGGSFTAASTTETLTGTDSSKGVTPDSLAAIWEQGSDIASASTISVGEGGQFNVTGTTTITDIDFATDKAGRTVWLKFAGILTLTHHSTTLILPTGANITTAAGDMACFRSEGSDNVRCIAYTRADGTPLVGGSVVGKQTIYIPASGMLPAITSGPAGGQLETATNKQNYAVLDFDATTRENAHFQIAFPKSWNEGTITFQVWWSSTATDTDGVAWGLEAIAISDNEAVDTGWGTAIVVTDDAQSAAGEVYVTAESSALTVGGTPVVNDLIFFRIYRDVADGNDDMTEDARLIGIKLFYTTDAANDA